MRAIVVRRLGPPGVLSVEEVADPVAGPGQVVIAAAYASVTFVETQLRAGRPPSPAMAPALPYVPGNGVGGSVEQVGEGADPALLGRAVVSTTGGRGGYAERVAVDAAQPIAVPDGVSLRDATALLADGRTALALLLRGRVRASDTVLVTAAGGGVGSCLVQLARGAGARVVAAASSKEKLAVAGELGAEVCADYSAAGWAGRLPAVDVVFDGVGGRIGKEALSLLRPAGRFCQFGMASGAYTAIPPDGNVELLQGIALDPAEMRALSAAALALAAEGSLRPTIGQVVELDRAADAHAAIEARRTIGKTLLRCSPRPHHEV